MESLSVIDFSSPDREKNAQEIVRTMETVGFLYLDNIPGYDVHHEEQLLSYTKWFFDLSLEKKTKLATRKYNKQSKRIYRGYFGLDHNYSSYKEGLELGPYPDYREDSVDVASGLPLMEENVWPQPNDGEKSDAYDQFRAFMVKHYR